jgi:hypothetical protein
VDVVDYPLGYLAYEADRDYFEVGPRDGKKPEVGTMTAADPRPSGQQGPLCQRRVRQSLLET